MAKYRQVHTTFWSDSFVLDLTPEEKYFYLYLMTNDKTTQCGIYELPKRIIEMQTGYNRETVDKLLARFEDYGKVLYHDPTKEIFMTNWAKYNWINSIKVITCIDKELKSVKNKGFVNEYINVLKGYGYRIDTLSIDLGEEEEKEEEEEENKNNIKPSRHKYEPCDKEMSELLFSLILLNNENAKKPNLEKWANDFRLMRERDKRTSEQITYLINWSQKDDFWKGNILSPSKLREKFDQLVVRVKQEKTKMNIGTHQKQNSFFKPSDETLERQNKEWKPSEREEEIFKNLNLDELEY